VTRPPSWPAPPEPSLLEPLWLARLRLELQVPRLPALRWFPSARTLPSAAKQKAQHSLFSQVSWSNPLVIG
jgi:hypothetical protein